MERRAKTLTETGDLGAALAPGLFPGAFLALYGGLGAGKTAFCQGLCQALGIQGVTSPTFAIVQEYEGPAFPLFHFDVYRLQDGAELYDMGYADYLDRGGVILMEWPENVAAELPGERLEVRITGAGEGPRQFTFTGYGQRHQALLRLLEGV